MSWGSLAPYPSFTDSGAPYPGRQNIDVDFDTWDRSAFGNLRVVDTTGIEVKIRTPKAEYESRWYEISNVGAVDLGSKEVMRLTAKELFGEDMLFTSNDGGSTMIKNLVL